MVASCLMDGTGLLAEDSLSQTVEPLDSAGTGIVEELQKDDGKDA
jgi:hypothetical protein